MSFFGWNSNPLGALKILKHACRTQSNEAFHWFYLVERGKKSSNNDTVGAMRRTGALDSLDAEVASVNFLILEATLAHPIDIRRRQK